MKRTYLTLIVAMLVVGFAAVTTNLVINGTINFGFNQNDFDSNVVFTYTNTMNGTATIQENGKAITFNTTKLENVNQQAIMDFDIANKSKQYDANVTIECGLEEKDKTYEDYLDIKYDLENSTFEIESGDTKSIRLTITLTKAYNESLVKDIDMLCAIKAMPEERDTEGTYTPKEHQYEEILLHGADPVLEATPVEGIALTSELNEKKLIPVTIDDDGNVKRADTTTRWYSYEDKKWANAVILNENVPEPVVGSEIKEEDIESYFVWIPKFRYKIFDMGKYDSINSEKVIDKLGATEVKFGIESTTDNDTGCVAPNESGTDGSCSVGKWMTHPAFTSFGDITGFWVGKFETGYRDASTYSEAEIDEISVEKIIIKPNAYSWRKIAVGNAYKNSFQYERDLDSHLMKNTEWGAVALLTHSIFGICDKDSKVCSDVRINNSQSYLTGAAAKTEPLVGYNEYKDFEMTVPYTDNDKTYVYSSSNVASTTGNITGVYDMSGGAWEYVMGVLTNSESVTNDFNNIIFLSSGLKSEDIKDGKYINLYINSTDIKQYSRRILGDATAEMGPFISKKYNTFTGYVNSSYEDHATFIVPTAPWVVRGGRHEGGLGCGIFAFEMRTGEKLQQASFRIVLSPQ